MAVIVDDGDAVPFAGAREAPLDATEARERLAQALGRDLELMGDRDGGAGVERIVVARHRHDEIVDAQLLAGLAIADDDAEMRLAVLEGDIAQPHIGLRILAIGDRRADR